MCNLWLCFLVGFRRTLPTSTGAILGGALSEPKPQEFNCFLDGSRRCDATCRAFEPKKSECSVLRNVGSMATSLQTLIREVSNKPPPRF